MRGYGAIFDRVAIIEDTAEDYACTRFRRLERDTDGDPE